MAPLRPHHEPGVRGDLDDRLAAPGTPQPSLAIVGGAIGSSRGPYTVLTFFVRPQPSNPFAGHPEHHRIAIPASSSLGGLQLFFLGALSPTTFDVSHPVGILL